MDRILRPQRLDICEDSSCSAKIWNHWYTTFVNFLNELKVTEDKQKMTVLTNFTSPAVYQHISDCNTYEEAISTLEKHYVKPVNEVYARYQLATRHQNPEESVDQYLQALTVLARNCQFKATTAETNKDDHIRDAFISGLQSTSIR